MTKDQLAKLLDTAGVKPGTDGWAEAADGQFITLHAASSGVGLTVTRVEAVRIKGGVVEARTAKGELYVLVADDVFAVAVGAQSGTNRRAGFV